MAPYERFAAWRECHALALEVYRATRAFPKDEPRHHSGIQLHCHPTHTESTFSVPFTLPLSIFAVLAPN